MSKDSIELALSVLEAEKANLSPEQLQRLAELAEAGEGVRSDVTDTLKVTEKRELKPEKKAELLSALETRFATKPEHYKRHEGVDFAEVKKALEANPALMYSLAQMENTGGAPDIIAVEEDAFVFGDCSAESPDRRDLTYDQAAEMAKEFGVEMMTKKIYRAMQESGRFDMNTWSWLATPADFRERGNALRGRRIGVGVNVNRGNAENHDPLGGWRGLLRVPKA